MEIVCHLFVDGDKFHTENASIFFVFLFNRKSETANRKSDTKIVQSQNSTTAGRGV